MCMYVSSPYALCAIGIIYAASVVVKDLVSASYLILQQQDGSIRAPLTQMLSLSGAADDL